MSNASGSAGTIPGTPTITGSPVVVTGPFTIKNVTYNGTLPGSDGVVVDGYISSASLRIAGAQEVLQGTADPGDTVTLLDNGVPFSALVAGSTVGATATADASGNWSINLNEVVFNDNRAIHTFTVTATDANGNVSASSNPLTLYIANLHISAPTLTTPSNVVNGYINAANYTGDEILTGTSNGTYYTSIYDNGVLLAKIITFGNTGSQWTYDLGALSQGKHSIVAIASDQANNVSAASKAIKFTVATVSATPTLTDRSVVNGYVTAATNKSSQALSGTAAAHATVNIYNNGTLLATTTANAGGAWRYTLGALADGTYALTAQATDVAGNVSAPSAALNFTVVTHAPTPAFTNATYDATTGKVTLSGTTSPGLTVAITDNNAAIGTATADATGAWTATVGIIASSKMQRYLASSTDAAGNVGKTKGQAIISALTATPLTGGAGNDLLIGAPGDTLAGAGGSNTFAFNGAFGNETITDFKTGSDVVRFNTGDFADWAHLLGATTQVGSDLVIRLDSNDAVTLKNVTLASFTASNAQFV